MRDTSVEGLLLGPRMPELRCKARRRAWKEPPPQGRQHCLASARRGLGVRGLQRRPSHSGKRGQPACRPGERVRQAGGEQGPAGTQPPCKQPHGPPRPVPSLRSAGDRLPAAPPCRAGPAPSALGARGPRGGAGPRAPRSPRLRGGGRRARRRPGRPPARPGRSSAGPGAAAAARPCPCRPPAPGSSSACSSSLPPCLPPAGAHRGVRAAGRARPPQGTPGFGYLSALFLLLFLLLRGGPALLICSGETASVPRPKARPRGTAAWVKPGVGRSRLSRGPWVLSVSTASALATPTDRPPFPSALGTRGASGGFLGSSGPETGTMPAAGSQRRWVPAGPETRPSLCRRPERQGGTAAQKRSRPPPAPAKASRVAAGQVPGELGGVQRTAGPRRARLGPSGGLPAAALPLLRSPGFRARARAAGTWQEGAGPTQLPCSLLSPRPGSSSPSPKRSESSFSLKEGTKGLGGAGGCTGPASSSVRSERSSRTGNSPWTGSRRVSRRPLHPPGCHVTPRGYRHPPTPGQGPPQ